MRAPRWREALLVALAGGSVAAQQPPGALQEVTIKGEAMVASPDQPYSVQVFPQDEIRERQISQPEQLFREVPGMEVRGLGYGGVANSVVLRGFSGGGHGGDIGFVIDGIPLNEASSHADGYADLNVLVPLELANMRVFKGPVSALYGNFNRAGVVALESRKGGHYREADLRLGAYGTVDLQAAAGGRLGGARINAAAQIHHTDSYRQQSGNQRATVALRAAFDLSSTTELAISTRLHKARADTASVITQDQYDDRHRFDDKHPAVMNDGSDKSFATLRADLSHQYSPGLKLLGFVYGTRQDFSRSFTRPTNATTWQQRRESYDRDVLGYGMSLNGSHRWLDRPVQWVAGVERFEEDTHFRYLDALDYNQPTPATWTAGVNGGSGALNRMLETRTSAVFAQGEWALHPLLRPSFGMRHDRVSGGCERRGPETRTGASAQCDAMKDFSATTPKLGLRSTWLPGVLEARASLAEGYALPGDAAKFTGDLAVEPTTFRQVELGFVFTPGDDWLIDLAWFRTHSRNEVALVEPATLTYANIGRTRREGLEAEVRWMPGGIFELFAALSHTRTRVLESQASTPWLVGSEITGVPRNLVTLMATLRPMAGLTLTATGRLVGRYAITQPGAGGGARHYGGFSTLDLMVSHEMRSQRAQRQRWFLQISNLTDRRHATSAGITGGTPTYNPGAPRLVMIGTSLTF